ncbi:hypothetical protein ALI144C_33130 [Actinosynnema sp. ALI-1.44]|nr:hypothetical protein ALI144C_33130 [Actinosynnema sp. ALI-1.44]
MVEVMIMTAAARPFRLNTLPTGRRTEWYRQFIFRYERSAASTGPAKQCATDSAHVVRGRSGGA